MTPPSDLTSLLNKVHLGRSPEFLHQIPDNTIGLTITSPPFYDSDLYILENDKLEFGWRTYTDYLEHLNNVLKELYRITVPGGKVVLILSNSPETDKEERTVRYWPIIHDVVHDAAEFGWEMFEEVIWSKKQEIYPYIKKRSSPETNVKVKHDVLTILRKPGDFRKSGTREYLSSVWYLPAKGPIKEYNKAYPSFPDELVKRCIRAWSLPHDIILDPYAGSAQVIRLALQLDRFGIGIEADGQWQHLWGDINGEET